MADAVQTEQPTMSRRENPRQGGRGRGRGRGRGGVRGAPRAAPAEGAQQDNAGADAQTNEIEPTTLFVAGFPHGTQAAEVGPMFEKFGPVVNVRLSGRGVGRVVFQTEDAAAAGVALNGTEFSGSKLRVERHRKIRRFPRRTRKSPSQSADGASPVASAAKPAQTRAPKPRNPRPAAAAASAEPVEQKPTDPSRVFVGRIPIETEDDAIKALFAPFGTIANYERARSKRFALVQFSSPAEAAKAVAASPALGEEALRVEQENPNTKKQRRPVAATAAASSRPPRQVATDGKRLYFGYLPEGTVASQVESAYSGVTKVELRGKFGYITFDSDASAQAALANPTKLGAEVRIEVAQRPERVRRERKVQPTA